MEQLFEVRQWIIGYYKRYENIVILLLKFIVGIVIFSIIGGIDRSMPMFEKIASTAGSIPYMALMSLIFAVTPINAGYLLITMNVCLQTSAVLEVSLVLGVFLLAVQGLYTRLAPEECVLILAMMIAYYFKLPYLVPILAGLYCSLASVIPIAIATFMWQFLPVVMGMFKLGSNTELSVGGLTDAYLSAYSLIVGAVSADRQWIISSFIFAIVVFIVYAVSRLSFNYSRDIAVGIGGAVMAVGFMLAIITSKLQIGIIGMLLSTVLSVCLAYVIKFFDVVLDYNAVEHVQFQDEDNMYYVKIVPKVVLFTKKSLHADESSEYTEEYEERDFNSLRIHSDSEHSRSIRDAYYEHPRSESGHAPVRRFEWNERWKEIERERQKQEGGR